MISLRPDNERRSDPRLENNIPVKICQDGGDFVAETQNISRSGVYCLVNKQVALMTKLRVHLMFTPPDEAPAGKTARKVSCEGVVVRSEPADGRGYHLAIFFSEIAKRDAEFITDYVNTYLQKESV